MNSIPIYNTFNWGETSSLPHNASCSPAWALPSSFSPEMAPRRLFHGGEALTVYLSLCILLWSLSLLLLRLSYDSSLGTLLMTNLGTSCNRSLLSISHHKLDFLQKIGHSIVNKHSSRMQRVISIATPNFCFVVHIPDQDSQQNYWWLLSHLICNILCFFVHCGRRRQWNSMELDISCPH